MIGTHALFQENVSFHNLALVIIDEQHKFGVHQRLSLAQKANKTPHQLVMTATPIPRTLTMTIYGDMDLSIIREKPNTRKPIKTYSKPESKIDDIIKFVKKVNPGGPGWKRFEFKNKSNPWLVPQGILNMFLGCIMVYALLIGTGQLIYGNNIPGALLMIIACLIGFRLIRRI